MTEYTIPSTWRWTTLSEIADVISGVSYDGAEECNSGIRILRGGNIQSNTIFIKSDDVFLPYKYKDEENTVKFGDTILVASTGSLDVLGKAAGCYQYLVDTQIGAFLRIVRPKDITNAPFITALLTSRYFHNYVISFAGNGTGINNIRNSYLLDFPIPLPPQKELENIASVLSNIDRKIALNRAMNEELEAMARQLYDYWFLQFDFPDANGKPYRSSGGKMVYNDILKREIPQGWEVKNIGDLLNKVKNTYKIPTKEYLKEGKYPIIDQSTDKYFAGWSNTADAVVTQHPVVVFGDHSCAVKYVDMDFCRGADGTQLISSNNVPTEYLYFAILNTRISSGYARHFNFLKNSPIIIPNSIYLKLYQSQTRPFFKTIMSNRMENNNLVKLRDELLPLLMNGQVTIKE